ncbi:MAG TPA: BamA/TamA family outer membrane protein [Vicinamibacteria bacterium]|nr:BamA/TamA family outer membrane protein [Vicinamibacteria bacterium]
MRPDSHLRAMFAAAAALAALSAPAPALAQYFGQNKVQYKDFDFQVMKTRHFEIYYYPEEQLAVENAARMAERWYTRLSRVLRHKFTKPQPLVLYASHTHFQQTNVLSGFIGEGTGGATELFKRRIVLPMAGPLAETDHVLGHELVHAFQFDMTGQGGAVSSGNIPTALRMPLWFIEGMAEYLSVGPVDPHTAMWMRDAVKQDRLPRIDQLDSPDYFPYRYGQALWSYIAGRWGDDVVAQALRASVRGSSDAESVLERVTGVPSKQLSEQWHEALREAYRPLLEAKRPPTAYGRAILTEENAGELNVGPSLSPDGRQIAFLSEKDLFSIDLYLADARTGQVRRKLVETATDPHFQSLQFLGSSGSWDRASRRFIFGAVKSGRAVLSVREASGSEMKEYELRDVDEVFDPSFSPDGRRVVFSAMTGGVTDLFVFDLETARLQRLTSDLYADLQPSWSPDGSTIVFTTDRFSSDLQTLSFGNYRLGLIAPDGTGIRPLASFADAKNVDPQWSADGSSVYFISDRNGISNVYRLDVASGEPAQVTDLLTGVSGITALSPALTVARDRLAFSVYENGQYNIYSVEDAARMAGGALVDAAERTRAAVLPPAQRVGGDVVALNSEPTFGLPAPQRFEVSDYKPKLGLDYIGQPTLTVGADPRGAFVGGGVSFLFSDILGNHTLGAVLQVNGRFEDIGGIVGYENRTNRWVWGAQVQQIPYVTGRFASGFAEDGTFVERSELFRETDRAVQGYVAYPFSRAQRFEIGAAARHISFGREIETLAFDPFTGQLIAQDRQKLDAPGGIGFGEASAALVYDTAIFGPTSPILGRRYRLEASPTFGGLQFTGVLADVRQYVMPVRPITLAGRLLHYGRYGSGGEDDRLTPLFIGYPNLVRGYDVNSFSASECGAATERCPVFDQLVGSRIAVANVELRLPLFGLFSRRNLYGPIPIELIGFSDFGVAWTAGDRAEFLGGDGSRRIVRSYGAGARINLFGYAVVEIDYVKPHDRPQKGWTWVFNFSPGF